MTVHRIANRPDREYTVTSPVHRSFDFARKNTLPPVSFTVGEVTIRCAPTMSTLTLLELSASGAVEGEKGNALASKAALTFLQKAILPEDWEKFQGISEDPDVDFNEVALSELAEWLAETYTANPTQPSSQSSGTSGNSGPSSTDGAVPEASTPLPLSHIGS